MKVGTFRHSQPTAGTYFLVSSDRTSSLYIVSLNRLLLVSSRRKNVFFLLKYPALLVLFSNQTGTLLRDSDVAPTISRLGSVSLKQDVLVAIELDETLAFNTGKS